MALTSEQLAEIIADLQRRPAASKHETVRTHVWKLLIDGLELPLSGIDQEKRIVAGRIDSLLGRTVFEFKSDLAKEQKDVDIKLPMYLREQEERTGERHIGVATDGTRFVAYEEHDGHLVALGAPFLPSKERPRELLVWLEGVVAARANVDPEPATIRRDLGKESVAYGKARQLLARMWEEVGGQPDVKLKRELWSSQLARVYGSEVDNDELFFQHTYLTVVAKTMATAVLGAGIPATGADLLDGKPFTDAAIDGAVEADFFNWVLDAAGGNDFVLRTAAYVSRFKLAAVQTDVLKGLYESLIDPEQRHELGEYYTPDWLAQMVCDRAIADPLNQRVLDPACGSGTFLFHAVRRFLAAAKQAGYDDEKRLAECSRHVFGIDAHPVASIIARVTYLLALGDLPVYLGDSLQWNTRTFVVQGELLLGPDSSPDTLHFPRAVAQEPALFDRIVGEMLDQSEQGGTRAGFEAWLKRETASSSQDVDTLTATYDTLKTMCEEGRDHVWGYVARNLSRPVWLASDTQRAHVIVGNPPWLSYRYMSPAQQATLKEQSEARAIWAGGKVATHQDLSGYFFVKSVELYLQMDGLIAFVMPYAAMNRKQFEGFRTGKWAPRKAKKQTTNVVTEARFVEAWTFDEHVQPLFPVPSCVLFAEKRGAGPLPATVRRARGRLKRRDATRAEADQALTWTTEPWPLGPTMEGGSPYREAFKNGATLYPRVLCIVDRVLTGALGGNAKEPLVQSHRTNLENDRWKATPTLRMPVEVAFVRPIYLGESIGPFRLLSNSEGIIPLDNGRVLSSSEAQQAGWPRLAAWLAQAEQQWERGREPQSKITFVDQLNYHGKLVDQFPAAPTRVIYAKSGTLPAAAILRNQAAVIDHKLYWAPARSDPEAYYLIAVLNSETARSRVAAMQSRGQWGARDFDKVLFELPIPKFDGGLALHRELADAAGLAEGVAATVDIAGVGFVRARGRIRQALKDDGVAARMEALVAQLLP